MPEASARRARIEELLAESNRIEAEVSRWQEDPSSVTPDVVRGMQRRYGEWYSSALGLIPAGETERFKDLYEGGLFTQRVKAFLADPLKPNLFYDPQAPSPLISKWQIPFNGTVQESFVAQRQVLIELLQNIADPNEALAQLAAYLERLPEFLATLRLKNNARVPAPRIESEADLQDLVHALLRLAYRDVREEDFVPEQAGGRSRVDFLLREAGVVIETKITRPILTDRQLGAELLIDWGRYTRHPDCRAIFALVFDPDRRLANAEAIEHDLSGQTGEVPTRVLVVR